MNSIGNNKKVINFICGIMKTGTTKWAIGLKLLQSRLEVRKIIKAFKSYTKIKVNKK
ncbi:MAG: hypothetical protein ABII74_00745 [Elusimicrobiota bacterium]